MADLDRLEARGDASSGELYDLSIAPLLHSRLHVFARIDEEDTPAAFIEFDLRSSLPLFGFVNATVHRYDAEQHLLVRNELDSSGWGMFRREQERVATPAGHREKTRHTFLWLFSWWGKETWHLADDEAAAPPARRDPPSVTASPTYAVAGGP